MSDTVIIADLYFYELYSDKIRIKLTLQNTSGNSLLVVLPIFLEEQIIFNHLAMDDAFRCPIGSFITVDKKMNLLALEAHESKEYLFNFYRETVDSCDNIDMLFFFTGEPGDYECHFEWEFDETFVCPYTHFTYDDILSYIKTLNVTLFEGKIESNVVSVHI